jgi:hypothetical protein
MSVDPAVSNAVRSIFRSRSFAACTNDLGGLLWQVSAVPLVLMFQSIAGGGGARLIGLPVFGKITSSHLAFVLFPSIKKGEGGILPVVLLLKVADFFTIRKPVSFSRRTFLRGVVLVVQVVTALFVGTGSYSPVCWYRFLQPCLVVRVLTAPFVGTGSYSPVCRYRFLQPCF